MARRNLSNDPLEQRLAKTVDFRIRSRLERVLGSGETLETLETLQEFIAERAAPCRAILHPFGVWDADENDFLSEEDGGRPAYYCLGCCLKMVARFNERNGPPEDGYAARYSEMRFEEVDNSTSSIFCDTCSSRLISSLCDSRVHLELTHLLVTHPPSFHHREAWADLEIAVEGLPEESLVWTVVLEEAEKSTKEALLSVLASRLSGVAPDMTSPFENERGRHRARSLGADP